MKKFRRLLLWFGLVFLLLLAAFSVYGAFLGAAVAKQFFNSIPLSVYWTLFASLIAVSIFVFPRLLKVPGLLAMHAGCVLIIAGSMWGSYAGHQVQRKYFGSDRIQSASMSIVEGYVQDKMYMEEGAPVNRSFKSIEIGDFSVEYSYDTQSIDFISNEETVRQEGVEIGRKIELQGPEVSIMPIRSINNLGFETADGTKKAVDASGGGSTPALEILIADADGNETREVLADISFYNLPFLIRLNDFRIEHYPVGKFYVYDVSEPNEFLIHSGFAEPGKKMNLGGDYGSITPLKAYGSYVIGKGGKAMDRGGEATNPAVEILVEGPSEEPFKKVIFENFPSFGQFSVGGKSVIVQYKRSISDYISVLEVVTEEGEVLAAKDIEVNKPLYYGGYHFYQSSFQQVGHGRYATILSVTSDSGLYCVFAGFIALCGGIVYHQWIRPILKKKAVRKTDGN